MSMAEEDGKGRRKGNERVADPATRMLHGLTGTVDDAAGEGARGCNAGLDAARDEVVVWRHRNDSRNLRD